MPEVLTDSTLIRDIYTYVQESRAAHGHIELTWADPLEPGDPPWVVGSMALAGYVVVGRGTTLEGMLRDLRRNIALALRHTGLEVPDAPQG